MKKSVNHNNHKSSSLTPKVLTHEEADMVYHILFPDDNGPIPYRPDILFSLEGNWTGWKDFLCVGTVEDELQKAKEDKIFIDSWNVVFNH
jgi:hypothetical protein